MFLKVSVDQEFRSGLAGRSQLGISHEVPCRSHLGLLTYKLKLLVTAVKLQSLPTWVSAHSCVLTIFLQVST